MIGSIYLSGLHELGTKEFSIGAIAERMPISFAGDSHIPSSSLDTPFMSTILLTSLGKNYFSESLPWDDGACPEILNPIDGMHAVVPLKPDSESKFASGGGGGGISLESGQSEVGRSSRR